MAATSGVAKSNRDLAVRLEDGDEIDRMHRGDRRTERRRRIVEEQVDRSRGVAVTAVDVDHPAAGGRRRVQRPAELRAGECRCLLEGDGRRW